MRPQSTLTHKSYGSCCSRAPCADDGQRLLAEAEALLFEKVQAYSKYREIVPNSRGVTCDPDAVDGNRPPATPTPTPTFRVCPSCEYAVKPEVTFCALCGGNVHAGVGLTGGDSASDGDASETSGDGATGFPAATLSLSDRAHVASALSYFLRRCLPQRASALAKARLESALLQFCSTCLDVLANPTYMVHVWEFTTLLDCCFDILALPAINYVTGDTSAPSEVVGHLLDRVIDLYRSFSARPSSVLLFEAAEGVQSAGPSDGGGKPDGDNDMDANTECTRMGLTSRQQHGLFALVEQLQRELNTHSPAPMTDGITMTHAAATLPGFILRRLRKLTIQLARMRLPLLNCFGLVVNPDTGVVPDYAGETGL